jgi:hypothetical protein
LDKGKVMNLILGTANWNRPGYGKELSKDECFKLMDRAKELGIKTLATAFDYGKDVADEYGWEDRIHKVSPGEIEWMGYSGKSLDSPETYIGGLIMAPFNPLDYRFKATSSADFFIARSIFCGGRLQRSNKEDIARLVFGFLKSHEVKNAVFGVESIEELELIVRVANEK